ncbi:MAG: heme-binding protein [Planctomycetota bacterium]|jgi:uncharacterized protein GlcG (DUF336 family)
MKKHKLMRRALAMTVALFAALVFTSSPALAVEQTCAQIEDLLPGQTWQAVKDALDDAIDGTLGPNGGFPLDQWVAVVDRDGLVCAVFFSGGDRQAQWPASRVISMQKSYTANSLSLDGLALSTANLWAATQPGGSLFGLQFSNPVNPAAAYLGPATAFGTGTGDPAEGLRVGGMNVFGGGLALYNASAVGGIGTSGNSSCADHIITWKIRDALGLDNIPGGVSPTGDDNIIFDIQDNSTIQKNRGRGRGTRRTQSNLLQTVSADGFGHPECGFGETEIAEDLPVCFPIGAVMGPTGATATCPAP